MCNPGIVKEYLCPCHSAMTIVRFRHLGPPQRARLESRGSVFPSTVHLPFVEPISNGFGMRSDVVPSVNTTTLLRL